MARSRIDYNKLVRDGIPAHLAGLGLDFAARRAQSSELPALLRAKLLEEAAELRDAAERDDIVGELADVHEVLDAIAREAGISADEIGHRRNRKSELRGGFDDGVVLVWAESDKD